ncbi:MAG: SH3 domain-containing protein [Anaerolineae bacterium]|nr:SH3 domain-containing protein [Anaerolineae bacterium]
MMHRGSRLLLLTALLFALLASIVGMAPALAQGPDATVRPDLLNMRHGPGDNYAVIAQLSRGTALSLLGQNGSWVYASAEDGTEGWLATAYLDIRADLDLNALPFRDAPADTGVPMQPQDQADQSAPADDQPPADTSAPADGFPEGTGIPAQILGTVNMRSGPGTDYRVLVTVQSGTAALAKGRNDAMDWIFVGVGGQDGWVFWEYVQLTSGYISQLPVSTTIVNDVAPPSGGDDAAAGDSAPAGSSAPPPPVAGGVGLSGFGYGGHIDGFGHVDQMHHAGMTWVKTQVRFGVGASGADTAGVINTAHANGLRILLSVVGAPGDVLQPGYFDDYARFVGEVAAAGPDAIEVWNEMNIDREWPAGHIDPGLYTELLAKAYNAIKSANPNVAVITGALAPTGAEGAFGADHVWNDDRYVRGMAAAGAARYMDCLGAHYNEGIVSPNQTSGDPRSEYYTRYFWGMVNTYWSAFGGARPICFTELGYVSPEGLGPLPANFLWGSDTSVAEQAQWLADAVRLARGSGKVRLVIVWNINFSYYGSDPMAGYAIVRPDGSCPACDALAGVR